MEDADDVESLVRARVSRHCRGAAAADIANELEELARAPAALPRHTDLRVTFLANILDNHGAVRGAVDRSDAVACIGDTVGRRYGQRKVVAGKDARLAALPWREGGILPRFGLIESSDRVSVSYARRAVAETGSVLLESGRDSPVTNSLLPEDHIVLVDSGDIVERLEEALPRNTPEHSRPRCIQIISGPSSTADIGLNMVYGAHGPRYWLVILIAPDAPDVARTAAALARDQAPAAGS